MRHFGTFVQVSFFLLLPFAVSGSFAIEPTAKKKKVARLSRARTRESLAIESNQEFSTACKFCWSSSASSMFGRHCQVLFFELFSLRARKKKQPVYFFLRRASAISPHDIYFCNRPHSQPHHQRIWCAARMFVVEYFSPSSSCQRSSVAIDGDCSRV